jgi:MoaA/NifB/PqqE/SkfB family radical SAM enzyme
MQDLIKIINPKDYRIMAGPDWPAIREIAQGNHGPTEFIQNEIREFIADQIYKYEQYHLKPADTLAQANQQRQAQVFYNKQASNIIGCTVPWNTMGVNTRGDVYICQSPSWVPKYVGNIQETTDIYTVLNSITARQIRAEILAGSYYYCNNRICGHFSQINPGRYNSTVEADSYVPITQVDDSRYQVKQIPKHLIFDFDYTCNLACPSCRTQIINWNKDPVQRPTNDSIATKIKQLIVDQITTETIDIRWCGGELFISDVYLDLIDYIVSKNNSQIKHIIQTNGSYLHKNIDLLTRLLPTVTELRISFDAADPATYAMVRRHGQWQQLLDNVRLVRKLIDNNQFETRLVADFVVQLDNYKEIPAFVELAKNLGIDNINFQKMWNWGTTSQAEFESNNVYNPDHPEYELLKEQFRLAGRQIKY